MFIRGRLQQSDAVCCPYCFLLVHITIHTVSLYSMSVLVNTNIVRACITEHNRLILNGGWGGWQIRCTDRLNTIHPHSLQAARAHPTQMDYEHKTNL